MVRCALVGPRLRDPAAVLSRRQQPRARFELLRHLAVRLSHGCWRGGEVIHRVATASSGQPRPELPVIWVDAVRGTYFFGGAKAFIERLTTEKNDILVSFRTTKHIGYHKPRT